MIDFIEGNVTYLETDYIVIETGGIGYRIFCTNPYDYQSEEGKRIRIHTHYHVKEDAMHLYGFATREQRELFRMLLEVNGVGPKAALSILASATPEQLVSAIGREDVQALTKFPGIGKKTAQRLILDLKDKLKGMAAEYPASVEERGGSDASLSASSSSLDEALEALVSLGYRREEINRILPSLKETAAAEAPADEIVKKALGLLVRS